MCSVLFLIILNICIIIFFETVLKKQVKKNITKRHHPKTPYFMF